MIGSLSSYGGAAWQSSNSVDKALARLSSGKRVNSAADDAAGLAVATQMAAQLGGIGQAERNVGDGLSLVDTANGALGQVSDTLQRMRELAVQAANGTYTASDRKALDAEFSQLSQNIDQLSGQTQFNGQNLLDGTFNGSIQSGPNASDTMSLSLANVSTGALGISGLDITSAGGATAALSSIDQAIKTVGGQQANIGAAQASLNSAAASLSGTYENLASAQSRIVDADYASTTANLASSQVQNQAALRAIALYNANQANVLGLLPGSK